MTAVLVHGVPDTHRVWDAVRSHLPGGVDIVAPDLPGFAAPVPEGFEPTKESYAAWLTAELESLVATTGGPVDLVGHDWGSLLAVRVATTRPDLVRTLACGGGPVDETYVWHDTAQAWQTPDVGEQVMAMLTGDLLAQTLTSTGLTEAQAAVVGEHVDERMKACILALYRSAVTVGTEWAPGLTGFARPALVLWGSDDPFAPAAPFAERMAARLGGRALVLDGCNHWWPQERPAEVAAALLDLWGQA